MTFADFEGARRYFYHDCDEETARWAFERLGPERFGDTTVTPVSVPRFWEADLPRSFIRCLQDRSMPQWLADTVTQRLGVEQLTIDTSHSPFLSRPAELAELLVHATTTTPVAALTPAQTLNSDAFIEIEARDKFDADYVHGFNLGAATMLWCSRA